MPSLHRLSTRFPAAAPVAVLLLVGCGGNGAGFADAHADTAVPAAQMAAACPDGIASGDIHPSETEAELCDRATFDTHTDLAYAPHERGVMDLLIPRNAISPMPVVVWIHGGGWRDGNKGNRDQAARLVCRGYALAAVNYRLSDTATFPAQIHDVKAAIRFLRANAAAYGLDGERIAAFGSSAGGHLAALAGTSDGALALEDLSLGNATVSSRVQATIDWYGPTRFSEMDSQLLAQGCPERRRKHSDADSAESLLLGCQVGSDDCRQAVRRADPSNYVDALDPPMLLLHGTDDCVVPLAQSTLIARRMQIAGACAVPRNVAGAGHGGPDWIKVEVQDAVADVLDRVFERP
jgi:acetyl esterase/lipase